MNKEGDALAADDVAQVVVPPPKTLSVLLVTDGNYFLESWSRSQQQLEKPRRRCRRRRTRRTSPTEYDVHHLRPLHAARRCRRPATSSTSAPCPDGLKREGRAATPTAPR